MMSSQQQQAGDRSSNFQAGLRVLVVDDDPESLKVIENNLKNRNYEVTTCGSAQDAINLLERLKELGSQAGFDLALCGVNKPQTNGLGFVFHAGLFESDLPLIMMSDYGDEGLVKAGIQFGTTHNIYMPIEPKNLSCIWQHAFRRRLSKMTAENEMVPPLSECEGGVDTIATSSGNKRKAAADIDPRPAKKERFIWTGEPHKRFVAAVEKLGDKATPRRIKAEMNMPGLTIDKVSSHLQKYRIALLRAQQKREDQQRQCTNTQCNAL